MELSIDTSSSISSLSLSQRGEIKVEFNWRCSQNHASELFPNLNYVLRGQGVSPHELTAIVVAKGPGSFNGLRVGIAAAKGLAFALDIPVVGISTLEVEAFPFSFYGLPVCSLHHLSKEEFAFAVYQGEGEEWQNVIPPGIGALDDVSHSTRERTIFCGELKDEVKCHIKESLGDLAVIPDRVVNVRRGGFLAYLGWKRLEEGEVNDILLLEPLYLRKPKITLKKGGQQ